MDDQGRVNQKYRTRKDLLDAASRLLKRNQNPSLADIADEAKVSRATAYRYFSNIEALISEVSLDDMMPKVDGFFKGNTSQDPIARLDEVEKVFHEVFYAHETHLRVSLANMIKQGIEQDQDAQTPLRQNRRMPFIEAALAPVRDQLDDPVYHHLCHTLSLIFGLESVIVFQDVLKIDKDEARAAKSWAIRALVEKALDESHE